MNAPSLIAKLLTNKLNIKAKLIKISNKKLNK